MLRECPPYVSALQRYGEVRGTGSLGRLFGLNVFLRSSQESGCFRVLLSGVCRTGYGLFTNYDVSRSEDPHIARLLNSVHSSPGVSSWRAFSRWSAELNPRHSMASTGAHDILQREEDDITLDRRTRQKMQ